MFDVVVTSAPATPFAGRVVAALREARMRVIACEVSPQRPPLDALRVDVAVACGPSPAAMLDVARSVRAMLDGPPPVIGVSPSRSMSPGTELAGVLPDDAPTAVLVAQVQRAAAQAERRRSRVIMRGDLDEIALESLLASLGARGRSCFVRVRAGSLRGEVTLEAGRPVHVRADGVDTSRNPGAGLAAMSAWRGASFEVAAGEPGLTPPRSERESARPPAFADGDAAEVALAAAVVNACSAYARVWLGPQLTANLLSSTWEEARHRSPGLDAFVLNGDGVISVSQVGRARAAIPESIATWIAGFFDAARSRDPKRFQRARIPEVLGGLMRLVEQVGWASVLVEGGAR